MNCAPIILFVYNRPWHTRQTIEALQRNELASESELFIYSDAAKSSKANAAVQEVRGYIYSVSGFKKITIIERKYNWGLADSIIDGVTNVVNKYGKVIVLEDDLVTSPYFLKFMNDGLDNYKDRKKIMHISGWTYPVKSSETDDAFLWRLMNCWGWATWADRWSDFSKKPEELLNTFSKKDVRYLNLDGILNSWADVQANIDGRVNTWAIFWYASIFKNDGLCLSPVSSLVDNIGLDGSGVHCGVSKKLSNKLSNRQVNIPERLDEIENYKMTNEIKRYMKRGRLNRLVCLIRKYLVR